MLSHLISFIKLIIPSKIFNWCKFKIEELVVNQFKKKLVHHSQKIEKRVAQIRKKKTIGVMFNVYSVAKWKAKSLYELMDKHERFSPIILATPDYTEKDKNKRFCVLQQLVAQLRSLGYRVVAANSAAKAISQYSPDIYFPCEPYASTQSIITTNMYKTLYCYAPYAYRTTNDSWAYNNPLQNKYLFNFFENDYMANIARQNMDNGGLNIKTVGYLAFDSLLKQEHNTTTDVWKKQERPLKRIIWAPHWSINSDTTPFVVSTFIDYAMSMIELTRKYNGKAQFAFKPHPLLYAALCKHPKWGRNKANQYYQMWDEMPNTQLETGVYENLFLQSDAMIHDCGSFIFEYLFVNKPCMYLRREDSPVKFNKLTLEAFNCYEIGHNLKDVDSFIQTVLDGKDNRAGSRIYFRDKYLLPPNNKSTAENIVDSILGNLPKH